MSLSSVLSHSLISLLSRSHLVPIHSSTTVFPAIAWYFQCVCVLYTHTLVCTCAFVYIVRLINKKLQIHQKCRPTRDAQTHQFGAVNISRPIRNPAVPIIWTLIGWHDSMQRGKRCLCVYSMCVCVCVYASGLMIQQGSQLCKGESRVREQLLNQRSLWVQHSRSMTCQPGLWIVVLDVLMNATHTAIFFFHLAPFLVFSVFIPLISCPSLKHRDVQKWRKTARLRIKDQR